MEFHIFLIFTKEKKRKQEMKKKGIQSHFNQFHIFDHFGFTENLKTLFSNTRSKKKDKILLLFGLIADIKHTHTHTRTQRIHWKRDNLKSFRFNSSDKAFNIGYIHFDCTDDILDKGLRITVTFLFHCFTRNMRILIVTFP